MARPQWLRVPRPSAEALCCAVVAACALAIVVYRLGPSLLGERVFLGLDLFRNFLPWARLLDEGQISNGYVWDQLDFYLPAYAQISERLGQGDLGVWTPYVGGGTPLLSLPIFGIFSPVRWPYLFLPVWSAPVWGKLLELAFTGVGSYLLLRRLRTSRPAAMLGGLVYPLTGFMIAWTNWPQTAVGAFIPALFWSIERFVQERRIRSAAPIAVVVAILMYGGFPAVAGLTLYAGGVYLVVRVVAERWRNPLKVLRDGIVAGAAVLVGLALSAVQLLPFVYTFLGEVDLGYRENAFFRVEPAEYLLNAVLPGSFAGNSLGIYFGSFNPIEVNLYLGTGVVILVLLAVLRRLSLATPVGARAFFVGLLLVSMLLIWVQGPLLNWLNDLPIFTENPIGRIRSLLCFAAAMLAGIGFDAAVRFARGERWSMRRRVVEAIVLLEVVLGLWLVSRWVVSDFGDDLARGADTDVVFAACCGLGVVGLLLLSNAGRWLRWVAVAGIPVIVAVQAAGAVGYYWPTGDRDEFYVKSSVHDYLLEHVGSDRVATAFTVMWPNTTAYYGIRTVNGHAFLPKPMRQLLLEIDPTAFPVPTASSFGPFDVGVLRSPGLDRLSAEYYVTATDFPMPGLWTVDGEPGLAVPLEPGTTYDIPMTPRLLRGLALSVPELPSGRTTLSVNVVDAGGEVLVSGAKTVGSDTAGLVVVPLAGEDLPLKGGPWTAEVTVTGPSTPVVVEGTLIGAPRLYTLTSDSPETKVVYIDDGIVVWERTTSLPRIRWASRDEVYSNDIIRLDAVAGKDFPDDTVVLATSEGATDGEPADVDVVEDSGDTIRANVDAEGAGYLVVADNIQTDWVATVDGVEQPIVDADYAVGAVHVERGQHEIILRYAPRGRSLGAWLSAGAALLLAAAAIPPRAWRRLSIRRRTSTQDLPHDPTRTKDPSPSDQLEPDQ